MFCAQTHTFTEFRVAYVKQCAWQRGKMQICLRKAPDLEIGPATFLPIVHVYHLVTQYLHIFFFLLNLIFKFQLQIVPETMEIASSLTMAESKTSSPLIKIQVVLALNLP